MALILGLFLCQTAGAQTAPSPANTTGTGSAAFHPTVAIAYPAGDTVSVKLRGTFRLPKASGEAKVERKRGSTEIEIELDEMKAAAEFGGDYSTYLLWTVSPEGLVAKAGELILNGNRSKLNVTTPLDTFAMIITAEPHFAVTRPSPFVVLENVSPRGRSIASTGVTVQFDPSLDYKFERETLKGVPEPKGRVATEWAQAESAIRLAERAGAGTFAEQELVRAREALRQSMESDRDGRHKEARRLAASAIRIAAEAQRVAEKRTFEAALAQERKERADELSRLESELQTATTQAERARLEAEKRKLELAAEAEARQTAEQKIAALRTEQEALLGQKMGAEEIAASAVRERGEAQNRLRQALSSFAETRDTERGLIVNLSDVLFEANAAELTPQARELLSRVAGILMVTPGLELSIEGHTDNTGSKEKNMELSRDRAYAVFHYLKSVGYPDTMAISSFGETAPLVPNTSQENRRKNRRVEIIISGIGESAGNRP